MAKIQVISGSWDETCTRSRNLTANQLKQPIIRDVIMYAEPRMLSTLIVSGAKSPWDTVPGDTKLKTNIGKIDKADLIGGNAYRYKIMGRIQKKSIINSQVGTSQPDGTFQLSLRDNYITPGMVVIFYSPLIQARVMSMPTGGASAWTYTFQTTDGTVFDYATHVAPQAGDKSCFGAFSSFGERSLRGYGRSHYPDEFINHLTIQRKTIAISGDALTDVLWYQLGMTKGWIFEKERQMRLQFMMEDEMHKWFSFSTMKDSTGNLLPVSRLIDFETGEEITIGDGVIPQIDGGNSMFFSGVNGAPTIDDLKDMMKALIKKSNAIKGKVWYVVTGLDGYAAAQELLRDYAINSLGGKSNIDVNAGGDRDWEVGYNFDTFNFLGNKLVFCQHPMFDDEEKFSARGADGNLLQSSMMVFLDGGMDEKGRRNIEIKGKGAYGINRTMVSAYINGLTGDSDEVLSSVDAKEFNMLKQDGLFIYNTQSCGLGRKAAA